MKKSVCSRIHFIAIFLIAAFVYPSISYATPDELYEVSAWVPYWRAEKGVASILPHIEKFSEVNPFMYTVKISGELNQADSITDKEWQTLRAAAESKSVRFIPTVMWANGDAMHEVFSNDDKRKAHIQSIAKQVFRYRFDGIDIDYEAKYAKTRPYFSLFLKELNDAIGYNKWIMCTIESRTPLTSRYSSVEAIPDDIEYSNDFVQINKYCDRVRLMAYDQGRFDVKLNDEKGDPYVPVADVDWVRKVVELAKEDIDADKIIIGVPTYGYEWDMFLGGSGNYMRYSKLWSFNPGYATEIAETLGLSIERSNAGEAMLRFTASDSPEAGIPLPEATRILMWSDAESIRQKAALAEELGVRGIAVFKIDGGEDQGIWSVLSGYKGKTLNESAFKSPDIALAHELAGRERVAKGEVPDVDLESGMRNEDVKLLQKYLNSLGYAVTKSGLGSMGNETTFFGAGTRSALIRFQKEYNITPAVGYYGPITRAMMKAL